MATRLYDGHGDIAVDLIEITEGTCLEYDPGYLICIWFLIKWS